VAYYRTSAHESCARVGTIPARGGNWPVHGIDATIPPDSIFTLTNVE
jgi:hypothetical protein